MASDGYLTAMGQATGKGPNNRAPAPRQAAPADMGGLDMLSLLGGLGGGAAVSSYDPGALMAAQQNAQNKVRGAQIAAELAGLQGGLGQAQADVPLQLGELEASRSFAENALQRRGILDRASLDNSMNARGLAQSGIRLGARGRGEADLLEGIGAVNLTSQQQGAQVQRAGAAQQGDLLARIAALRAEMGAM